MIMFSTIGYTMQSYLPRLIRSWSTESQVPNPYLFLSATQTAPDSPSDDVMSK